MLDNSSTLASRSLKFFKGKEVYRAPGSKAGPQFKIQMHLALEIPGDPATDPPTPPVQAQHLVTEVLIHLGAEEKYGAAPQDAMDRQAQARLTSMRK